MKSSRLLSILRNSFFVLEWASGVLAAVLLATGLILVPYLVGTPGMTFAMPIYRLKFDFQPALPPMPYQGTSAGTVALENIQGDLIVQQSANPGVLLNFVRWRTASASLLLFLTCAIFSLFRRLFDNVRQGAAFSLKSVRLIRKIGWCCLAYCAVASLVASTLDALIAGDLSRHLAIAHLRTSFVSADVTGGINFFFRQVHLKLDLATLGIALTAFVLAEVFRQGVLLKEENDLTI